MPLPTIPTPVTSVQLHPTVAAALPSARSALALANGEPGALPMVLAHTALRAGIIGVGLMVAGQRRGVVKTSIVSSLAIEAFVLGWAAWQRGRVPPSGVVNT